MEDCKDLINKLTGGEQGLNEAFKRMSNNERFRKSARYVFGRYPELKRIIDWEDIFYEGIARFTQAVLSGRKVANCEAFFFGICKYYALELLRKLKEGEMPEDFRTDAMFQALRPYVEKLNAKCRLLLKLLSFNRELVNPKNRELLTTSLKAEGYDISPDSVSSTISKCKRQLKELIHKDLDNFEGFDL